jgi:Tfp pilus assembly ATPase PilU
MYPQGTAKPKPHIDSLLETLWQVGGTDLLLTVGAPPLLRLNGELRSADADPLSAADTSRSRGATRPASGVMRTPSAGSPRSRSG